MYRLAGILGGIWIGLCFASFLSGLPITLAGAPGWLPLPWSDLGDFVEGPDGRVYVGLRFYHRVLCYSCDGQFIASYRPPSGKNLHMAADTRGHIYCLTSYHGRLLGEYNGDWDLLREYSEPYRRDHVWRLQANGEPALDPAPVGAEVADRPAKPGDIIFGDGGDRRSFACTDGTTLIRRGNHVERLSADGRVITQYAGPVLLQPLTFPWPAVTAWPLAFLMAYVHTRKKQWASQPGVTRVGRVVLVDVLATVLLITVTGTIWFAGLKAMLDFITSHKELPGIDPACCVVLSIAAGVHLGMEETAKETRWPPLPSKSNEPRPFDREGNHFTVLLSGELVRGSLKRERIWLTRWAFSLVCC